MAKQYLLFTDEPKAPKKRTPQKKKKGAINLVKLVTDFGSEDKARTCLIQLRWPEKLTCLRCKGENVTKINEREQFCCNDCDYHFSVTSGTIFHDTHLPLWKWFLAIYLITESKKGISANQISRTLELPYKTAWYLCHRIRAAMAASKTGTLKGIVEVDETYVGGKVRGKGKGYRGNKTAVVGAKERGGKVVMKALPFIDREALHKFVKETVDPSAEAIHTDEHFGYKGIATETTRHESVNHSKKQWVTGDIHTNGIEGVWSLLKRSIVGTYHKVSVKHLDAYVGELEHRFNNRSNPYIFRDTLSKMMVSENLPLVKLVGKPETIAVD